MKHCLVVDDSRVVRTVARRILEGLEFTTDEAEDGAAALELCRKDMPDAILLDSHLPNMTGAEFLRALRREPGGDRPAVLFCTIENDVAQITEAILAGANEYMLKPFDRELIEAKLTEIGIL